MDQLTSGDYKIIEIPVTFGCDGSMFIVFSAASGNLTEIVVDRRKELNMIKKTAAFNWSGASVSTCLWRGVFVRDILLACGLQDQPDEERWYVYMLSILCF